MEVSTMELLTLKAGWGRNRRFEIKDGKVRIFRNGMEPETTLSIKDGRIVKVQDIEFSPRHSSTRIVTTKAWEGFKRTRAGAVKTIQRYDTYSNLLSNGAFYEVKGLTIGKHKGTFRQISRRVRFVREEFVYDNGQEAYVWTPYRKRFQVFRPNGMLWMEVTAKVRQPYKRTKVLPEQVQTALEDIAGRRDRWSKEPDYEIR